MMSAFKSLVAAGALTLAFAGVARAEEAVIPYTLDTCPVSGKPIASAGDAIAVIHEGREYRFCCQNCPKAFTAAPAKFVEKVNAKLIEAQSAGYPLKDCPVSGHKLGEMGDPIKLIHGDTLVELCCEGCRKEYDADPGKVAAKVQDAIKEKQGKTYTLKTCPISGKELTGNGVEKVYAGKLIRFCCNDCVKVFEKNPLPTLQKMAEPAKK